ncbi:hypothetical protein D3Z09_02875 [Rahnella aquatilis]|nr:hypothetical protein D3Z09_02875 [Rahnella aquatilis]
MNNITQFKEYIDYYKKLSNPGYAVLITGEWGSGKTHQINNTLKQEEMYYISLFDINSVDDIYAAVFYKMSPIKSFAKGASNALGETSLGSDAFTLGLGGLVGRIASAVIKEEIKKDRVIVFDDLERCSVDINEILGVINKYVEHHECKVIAIAHDEKIKNSFDEAKEKVIGQTLRIEPNIEEIFDHFLNQEEKNIMPNYISKTILMTFIASECKSMRILNHTIKDSIRLLDCLNEKNIKNEKAMYEIFSFFTALSVAYRYGKIKEIDLIYRSEQVIKYYVNKDKMDIPPIAALNNAYKKKGIAIDLSRNTLKDETVINCLVKGYYDKEKIALDVNENSNFNKQDSEAWVTLMSFDSISPEEVESAINDINNQLANFSITDSGKILHIFNLKLLMTFIGAHELTYAQVFIDFKNYLRKLLEQNKIDLPDPDSRFSMFSESSHGYGYWVKDEYRTISNTMFNISQNFRKIALQKKFPSYIEEITYSMTNEPSQFLNLVSSGYHGQGKYAYVCFLNFIKPILFVERWLESPVQNWQKIRDGLEARYSSGGLRNQLSDELPWIKNINYILNNFAAKERGFNRLRIERLKCKII